MAKTLCLLTMVLGCVCFLAPLLGGNPAWSQTVCGPDFVGNPNFCHTIELDVVTPPSPPATALKPPEAPNPRYPLHFFFGFFCADYFTGLPLDCGFSVELVKPLDSNPAVPSAANGGHLAGAHGSPHPLIEPPASGELRFAGLPGSSGRLAGDPANPNRLKMIGQTGHEIAVVLDPVPQASGDLLVELFTISPLGYNCGVNVGCFDQVPFRHGLNRRRDLLTLHVGIPNTVLCPPCHVIPGQFQELLQTPDAPFVLRQGELQRDAHPKNHFGTATALNRIRQIAEQYRKDNPGLGKLRINDISLIRGGVYDLKKQWVGDNLDNPHWGHRTGTEVDIETTDSLNNDTSCTAGGGGNDLVKDAVKAVIKKPLVPTIPQGAIAFVGKPFGPRGAHRCEPRRDEPGGRNHVYLQ